jgi:hypothetical protein
MSSNVFLAPCDAGNFDRTIVSEVDLSEYSTTRPEELSEMDTVRFWGVREGSRNEDYFERMDSGDLVLFYQNGNYVGTGWAGITFEDDEQWASRTFWNDAPSRLIYTVEEFTPVSVPKVAVNQIFNYDEGYNPQGLIRVAESKLDKRPVTIKRALEKYTEKHR